MENESWINRLSREASLRSTSSFRNATRNRPPLLFSCVHPDYTPTQACEKQKNLRLNPTFQTLVSDGTTNQHCSRSATVFSANRKTVSMRRPVHGRHIRSLPPTSSAGRLECFTCVDIRRGTTLLRKGYSPIYLHLTPNTKTTGCEKKSPQRVEQNNKKSKKLSFIVRQASKMIVVGNFYRKNPAAGNQTGVQQGYHTHAHIQTQAHKHTPTFLLRVEKVRNKYENVWNVCLKTVHKRIRIPGAQGAESGRR